VALTAISGRPKKYALSGGALPATYITVADDAWSRLLA
jgi:hypothetical protein